MWLQRFVKAVLKHDDQKKDIEQQIFFAVNGPMGQQGR